MKKFQKITKRYFILILLPLFLIFPISVSFAGNLSNAEVTHNDIDDSIDEISVTGVSGTNLDIGTTSGLGIATIDIDDSVGTTTITEDIANIETITIDGSEGVDIIDMGDASVELIEFVGTDTITGAITNTEVINIVGTENADVTTVDGSLSNIGNITIEGNITVIAGSNIPDKEYSVNVGDTTTITGEITNVGTIDIDDSTYGGAASEMITFIELGGKLSLNLKYAYASTPYTIQVQVNGNSEGIDNAIAGDLNEPDFGQLFLAGLLNLGRGKEIVDGKTDLTNFFTAGITRIDTVTNTGAGDVVLSGGNVVQDSGNLCAVTFQFGSSSVSGGGTGTSVSGSVGFTTNGGGLSSTGFSNNFATNAEAINSNTIINGGGGSALAELGNDATYNVDYNCPSGSAESFS